MDGPWRQAFELAWEAFRAGTIPVGAVVVEGGEIVARGRNRVHEDTAPARQLAGTMLAHAEVNAIAQLDTEPHDDAVLYTTLEPCLLCVGAAAMARVGTVRYASPDPFAGGGSYELDNAFLRLRRTVVEGPLEGLPAQLGELLHLAFFLRRNPGGSVISAYRELGPAAL